MNVILRAAQIAERYHKGQERKSNGKPYRTHFCRVAGRAATHKKMTENDVAACFLHDTIEDQATTPQRYSEIIQVIRDQCGQSVLDIVVDLTNPSRGSRLPRADRKQMDRKHLAVCPKNVKLIKLFDRIDNLHEFTNDALLGIEPDIDFLLLYADESEMLLHEALRGTDLELEEELAAAINKLREVAKSEP